MMIKIFALVLFSNSMMVTASSQGICTPEALTVTVVSGRVIQMLDKGEQPVSKASVVLRRQYHEWLPIAETKANDDGRFSFSNIGPGKYLLTIRASDFKRLDIPILVKNSSKSTRVAQEIVVTLGFDFAVPCGGGHAEMRNAGS